MRVAPVRSYARPGYPIRPEVDANPELLRLLPKRWQGNAAVVAALTACVAMSGCGKNGANAPSRVAPVFVHGEGMAAFACIAVNPPVFLSEDEARKVIVDEAKRSGIAFDSDGKTLQRMSLPSIPSTKQVKWKLVYQERKPHSLSVRLDGYDARQRIAYEYVSGDDLEKWKSGIRSNLRIVGSYSDVKGTAKALRASMAKAKVAGTYAVFYDPLPDVADVDKGFGSETEYQAASRDWSGKRAKLQAMQKDVAREQLRAQVKDFIKWLKAQGVI